MEFVDPLITVVLCNYSTMIYCVLVVATRCPLVKTVYIWITTGPHSFMENCRSRASQQSNFANLLSWYSNTSKSSTSIRYLVTNINDNNKYALDKWYSSNSKQYAYAYKRKVTIWPPSSTTNSCIQLIESLNQSILVHLEHLNHRNLVSNGI